MLVGQNFFKALKARRVFAGVQTARLQPVAFLFVVDRTNPYGPKPPV